MFRFASPWWVLLILILPLLYFALKKNKSGAFIFSGISLVKSFISKNNYHRNRLILRGLALLLLIIGMMRPQQVNKTEEILTKGIDIMLAIDISSSMKSMDFAPNNRLDAAKQVVADFIRGRKNDRIGMVIFSAHSFTQCPLTMDYGILLKLLDDVQIGQIEDGTAIGMAIATSVKRLKDSGGKSKVIILLTDGVNNTGKIDPMTAANLAQGLGMKIYSIGVGREIMAETKIDEELLRKISQITNGIYFRAEDERSLRQIYDQIDSLEKTEIKMKEYFSFREYFFYFVLLGLILLVWEFVLYNILKPKFP